MGGGCHSNGQDMKYIIVDKTRSGGIHKKRCRCGERLQVNKTVSYNSFGFSGGNNGSLHNGTNLQ